MASQPSALRVLRYGAATLSIACSVLVLVSAWVASQFFAAGGFQMTWPLFWRPALPPSLGFVGLATAALLDRRWALWPLAAGALWSGFSGAAALVTMGVEPHSVSLGYVAQGLALGKLAFAAVACALVVMSTLARRRS